MGRVASLAPTCAAGVRRCLPAPVLRRAIAGLAVCLFAATAPAFDLPGTRGRLSVGGFVETSGILRVDPGSPQQAPAGIVALKVTGEPHRRIRFFLDTRFVAGGTVKDGSHFGVVNLSDTFVRLSPSVEFEEGYVDFSHRDFDVRIGKQKFAWGRLDGYQPTNVINPRRATDPILTEEQDAEIGVPAVRADYFVHVPEWLSRESRFTLVWVPVPIPARFPLDDERWFPASASVPEVVFVTGRSIAAGVPDTVVSTTFGVANRRPPQQLDEGSVALRLTGLTLDVDWGLVFYDGAETVPAFDLRTVAYAPRVRRKLAEGMAPTIDDLVRLKTTSTLLPRFGRIRLVGGDAASRIGGFTARVEAAYGQDRLLPVSTETILTPENLRRAINPSLGRLVRDLLRGRATPIELGALSVERDVVTWGIGIDYNWEGWMPLVQVSQTLVLDNPTNLLINDVDTRLAGFVRRNFLSERLLGELMVAQGLERGFTIGRLRLTYALTDNLRVRAGYVLIAGSRTTLPGQFHDNDEGFLQVRYSY